MTENKEDDPVETALDKVKPILAKVTFGAIMGYSSGYALKKVGKALAFVKGIAGAAEMGNQKTILVLDVAGLMSEALRGESALNV